MMWLGIFTLIDSDLSQSKEVPQATDEFGKSQRFFSEHCLRCHGIENKEGDVDLRNLDVARLDEDNVKLWTRVLEQLKLGEMPPEDEPRPSKQATDQIATDIQDKLSAIGHESDIDYKLKQPAYANLINHDKLFDGSVKSAPFSPPRFWRLHPEAYENFLAGFGRELSKGGPLSKPFTVGEGKGLVRNYAELMQADSATLGQLMLNCQQIAQLQTFGFKQMEKDRRTQEMVERIYRKVPETFQAIIDSETDPTDEQIQAAVLEEFQIVLRRAPSESESIEFADLLRRSITIGGKERGLRTMAMALLLRPESIYRMEIGLGETDQHGRRELSPYELAHSISYALTDLSPEKLLLGPPKPNDRNQRPTPPSLMDLARDGRLKNRDDVRDVVTLIWEHDGIEKPRILRFFHEFFGYHTAETVFKGDRAGREFMPKHLVKDADDLVMHIVDDDRNVLKELLTTDRFFVTWLGSVEEYDRKIKYITDRIKPDNTKDRNYKYFIERTKTGLRPMPQANPTWRTTVQFYNLDEQTWDYPIEQPFELPQGQRIGILTHPAWLAAWSGNFSNDPIRRGKWIRENLLAGTVPDIPITVDAQVPEDHHKTLRQRLEATREEYCWQCHQKMNPLGMPFEAYDDFGQFRTEEGLGQTHSLKKPKVTAPVETHGEIIKSGDSTIDGDVKDVHDLMHRLASSNRVRQSFVRHSFRYWMGRNEMLSDSPTLISADHAYVNGGGSFKSLVIDLLTSDSFLYRK